LASRMWYIAWHVVRIFHRDVILQGSFSVTVLLRNTAHRHTCEADTFLTLIHSLTWMIKNRNLLKWNGSFFQCLFRAKAVTTAVGNKQCDSTHTANESRHELSCSPNCGKCGLDKERTHTDTQKTLKVEGYSNSKLKDLHKKRLGCSRDKSSFVCQWNFWTRVVELMILGMLGTELAQATLHFAVRMASSFD
jgi:hypothetical protein